MSLDDVEHSLKATGIRHKLQQPQLNVSSKSNAIGLI